jgi:hypothetical protein
MADLMPSQRFAGWLPIRVFWRDSAFWVDWCYFGNTRLTAPFFRDSVTVALRQPFNQAFRRETPIAELQEWHHASPGLKPLRPTAAGDVDRVWRCVRYPQRCNIA